MFAITWNNGSNVSLLGTTRSTAKQTLAYLQENKMANPSQYTIKDMASGRLITIDELRLRAE
jgi:hypothetical protein